MPKGIIVRGIGGFYYIKSSDDIYECKARGIFRKDNITPLVGDDVEFSIIDNEKKIGWVDVIFPRKSFLIRPATANVNFMAIIIAVQAPIPDLLLLDKLLIYAHDNKITPFVCINKIDLAQKDHSSASFKEIQKIYSNAGFNVLLLSALENKGFEKLHNLLKNNTTVFTGQSGVGKSTIFNKILNRKAMEVGDVSKKISRGKHTTRHTELIELNYGGYVLDTPGFSSFELIKIDADELKYYYPEFEKYEGSCKFKSCNHINEPGCKIKSAIEDKTIDSGRYFRYTQLYEMLKNEKR